MLFLSLNLEAIEMECLAGLLTYFCNRTPSRFLNSGSSIARYIDEVYSSGSVRDFHPVPF